MKAVSKPFVQPGRLNLWLFPELRQRGRVTIALATPLFVYAAVMMGEMFLLRSWLIGWSIARSLTLAFTLALVFGLGLWAFIEALLWVSRHSQRVLELGPKRLRFRPPRWVSLSWDRLQSVVFEPAHFANEAARITLEYVPVRRAKRTRSWSLLLTDSDEIDRLASELECLRRSPDLEFDIVKMAEPRPPTPAGSVPRMGVWILVASLWCFTHGFPLLGVGLLGGHGTSESPSSSRLEISPERREQVGRFLLHHFSTIEEFQRALIAGGGALTALAAVLFFAADQFNRNTDSKKVNPR
ncbi:MAG TPA: hypothetical protein PLX89_04215 [Verrucomicrobiota bacterium]|nr:hypothetical protein [Verrucomicrobiota bacterium]